MLVIANLIIRVGCNSTPTILEIHSMGHLADDLNRLKGPPEVSGYFLVDTDQSERSGLIFVIKPVPQQDDANQKVFGLNPGNLQPCHLIGSS